MIKKERFSVLFICTGNICRSPTADGVLRHLVRQAGLQDRVEVDSAGTHDYHIGEAPDRRTQAHAVKRGYDLCSLRAREVASGDFARFDLVLAMDRGHLALLQRQCPAAYRHKVRLFLEFATRHGEREVPDPYYGGAEGFEHVLDLVEDGCAGLLAHVREQLVLQH
ncbi:low molecular weight phosphotyrosine protein phosphatase [Chitiniphilus purpureus]|uniref:Low molecular weight phosphotyrosine protein phosphatase n=1 Tax=Chitiniphilus purpureus TaxID=2981137 RepID=A0ABY6DR57_9NEIS|nr:low molecular weight protein-tyrosine-phosphatase [Chitiniphilus sp. CD1]UXY14398.1 low molecular weight phosphotyrosine protein phosphatase [Chitiniphilus sp. CD1]